MWVEKTNAKKENQVAMEKTLQSAHNQFLPDDEITTSPIKEVFDKSLSDTVYQFKVEGNSVSFIEESTGEIIHFADGLPEGLIPPEIVSNHKLPIQMRQKGKQSLKRKKKTKEINTFRNELMHTKEAIETKQVVQTPEMMHDSKPLKCNKPQYSRFDIKKSFSPLKSYPDNVVIVSDDSLEAECVELLSSDEDSEKLFSKKTEDNPTTYLGAENFESFVQKQSFLGQSKTCQAQPKIEEHIGLAHLNDYVKKEPVIHSCFTYKSDISETTQNKIGTQDNYTEISDSELSESILSPAMVCDISKADVDNNDKNTLNCDEELYFTAKGVTNFDENNAATLFFSKTVSKKFTPEYLHSEEAYKNSFLGDCKLSTQNLILPLNCHNKVFISESTESCTNKTQAQENIPRKTGVVKDSADVLSTEEPVLTTLIAKHIFCDSNDLPNVNQVENSLIENLFAKTFNSEVSSLLANSSCAETSPIKHKLVNPACKSNMTSDCQKNQEILLDGFLNEQKDILTKNVTDVSVSYCNDQLSLANTVLIDTITPSMDSASNNELEICQNDFSNEQNNLLSSSSQIVSKDKKYLVNEKVLNIPKSGHHSFTNEQKLVESPNEMLKSSVNVKKSKQHHLALQRNTALFLTKFNKMPTKKVQNLEHHNENYLETSKNDFPLKINPTGSEQSISNCADDVFLGSSDNKVTDESDYSYQR